jgi:hypothetical protein
MAKKKTSREETPATPTTRAAAPARQRTTRTPKSQAAAPVDIATIARTEPLDSAADTGAANRAASAYEPSHHEVAEAAYLRYLKRRGQPGDEFNDWVEAERELRSRDGRP